MTRIDWFALLFIALAAFFGYRKGLISSALSVAGIVVGAIIGARLAPHLLAEGSESPYTPLVGLAGAAVGAVLLETLGTIAGSVLRRKVEFGPARAFDSGAGLLLGAAAGIAVVWVLGSVALQFPGRPGLRESVQRSFVLQQLNDVVPPAKLMRALARVDPFPAITGPAAPVAAPDPRVLADLSVRQASPSVLKVLGTACGLGVSGSGWVAAPELVVTAAHVVAGQDDTTVEPVGGVPRLRAHAVYVDRRNDVAVLARARPRRVAAPARQGAARCCRRDPRLPGERAVHRDRRAHRQDAARARARQLRGRAAAAHDHQSSWTRAPRQLGRAGDRRRGTRPGDDLRRAPGRRRRLRRPGADRASRAFARSAREPVSTGDCAR